MAVPKRRISRARRAHRRITQKLTAAQLVPCKNCGTRIRPHHVCSSCGFYRATQVTPGAGS